MSVDMSQFNSLSDSELSAINRCICDLIKTRHAIKLASAASQFYPGQIVSFEANNPRYHGQRIYGTIKKVNRLNIKLLSNTNVNWTVSANLLRKEEKLPEVKYTITPLPNNQGVPSVNL